MILDISNKSCLLCPLVCIRLKRPVRCMLDRDEDMLITGGRHPFYGKYKVDFCTLVNVGEKMVLKQT